MEALQVGPVKLSPDKERKIIIFASIFGIILFVLYFVNKRKTEPSGGYDSGLPGYVGGGSSGFAGLGQISELQAKLEEARLEASKDVFSFSFSRDLGQSFTASATSSNKTGSGSGLDIGFGNGSLGFSNSKSDQSGKSGGFQNVVKNLLSGNVFISGMDNERQLEDILNFYTRIGGDYDQALTSQIAQNSINERITTNTLRNAVLTNIGKQEYKEQIRQTKRQERLADAERKRQEKAQTQTVPPRPIGPPIRNVRLQNRPVYLVTR